MAVRRVKLIVFIIVVLVGLMVAGGMVPIIGPLGNVFEYIGGLGSWGPVALCGFYTASCVFLIPASIPTLAAGFLFGVFKGSITAMVGGTAGAVAAFWIGRIVANGRAQHRTARSHWLTSLDDAVSEEGFKVVLLSRLSPVFPYAILNYAFGLTKVSFRHYVCGTVIGVLPAMVMYVYVGAGLRSLSDIAAYAKGEGQATPALRVFFWGGLVVTVVVTIFLTHMAKTALQNTAANGIHDPLEEPESHNPKHDIRNPKQTRSAQSQ